MADVITQFSLDKIEKSFDMYSGINLTGTNVIPDNPEGWNSSTGYNDNACFYIKKGTDDYPYNQESYEPFGVPYLDPKPEERETAFEKSLRDVNNSLYDMSYKMYNMSKVNEITGGPGTVDALYYGISDASISGDQGTQYKKFININTIERKDDENMIIPYILLEICGAIKALEKDYVKLNGREDDLIDLKKVGTSFMIGEKNIVDHIKENTIGELFNACTTFSFDIPSIGFKNVENDYVKASNAYGRFNFAIISLKIEKGGTKAVYFKVYFNPDTFFYERLGNESKIDVWFYREGDDPYNLNYDGQFYSKLIEEAEKYDDKKIPTTVLNIDVNDLQEHVLKDYRKNNRYSRHTSFISYTLERRIFNRVANGIHKLGDGETDYKTTETFYVFYSSKTKPSSTNIRNVLKSEMLSFVRDNYYEDLRSFTNTTDFNGESETFITDVINYVYPELNVQFSVYIRRWPNLKSVPINTPGIGSDTVFEITSEGVSTALNTTNPSDPPFYTTSRGKVYKYIQPCYVKGKDNTYNDKVMGYPQIAYVVNQSTETDASLSDFTFGYKPIVLDLFEPQSQDPNWKSDASNVEKLSKLLTYAAIIFSQADKNILNEGTPLLTALRNDENLEFDIAYDNTDLMPNVISFKISGRKYTIISPKVTSV